MPRVLIGEPRAQAGVARGRIERALVAGEKVVVTDLVGAEAFHALRHDYDVPQATALGRLPAFFSAGIVHVDPLGAEEALGQGTRGHAGVVDRLIVARHRALGATTATFARRQARLEGRILLQA